MSQLSRSTSSFLLPEPSRPKPAQWPAYLCIVASTLASVIVLVPSAGDVWSSWTYPTVARIDQHLAPYGLGLGPRTVEAGTPEVAHPLNECPVLLSSVIADEEVPEDAPPPAVRKPDPEPTQGPIVRPVGMTTRIPIAPSDSEDLLQ